MNILRSLLTTVYALSIIRHQKSNLHVNCIHNSVKACALSNNHLYALFYNYPFIYISVNGENKEVKIDKIWLFQYM